MRTIIAIILLILIISLGIFEQIFLDKTFTTLEEKANIIKDTIDQDPDRAIELTLETIEWWNKKLKILETMVTHTALTSVSIQLYDVQGQLEGGDNAQAIGACYVLIGLCESIPHQLGFQIQHIF